MTESADTQSTPPPTRLNGRLARAGSGWLSIRVFSRLIRLSALLALLGTVYWALVASDRYVSEANVIIRKTDSLNAPALDFSLLVSGVAGVNRPDQLLLREYLLSVDMLKALDAKLDLRSHYSDSGRDIVSRMWFKDASMEWFHRHFLGRLSVDYDDFAGVLRLRVQAYDAQTAQAISSMLVQEGERYMNQLGHEMAEAQVSFLIKQVNAAQIRFQEASQRLLNFQNEKGLLSPQATAESISTIIAGLETQRAQIQTQLGFLPKTLDRDHPNIVMLRQSLAAVDRQIQQEKAKLATPSGKTLNVSVEEFQRLQMEVGFTQDLYKSSLVALEKGRIDASRMLEKVSVLQAPTLPEYPMEPRRIYNTIVTLLVAAMLAGILKLLESIVMDHLD
ncbi:MAG: chain-length determining protein [Candidatus Accumulibacter sp.]|uniref:chain-length determining protein n=1 Tax=Accumulibacter sp. TaxID=2053492 RepID=UPI00287978AB|nr:chain-length determining protein [Accumulibacter sp.]MDS4015796.1 chain-length determining protein [Accumulibacter sp.]